MLLPSPGPALVTTIVRSPSSADEKSTLVRTVLNRLREVRARSVVGQQRVRRVLAAWHRRNHAEERHAEVRLQFLRCLDPVVEVLEEERRGRARASGPQRVRAIDQVAAAFGEIGARGTSAAIDDADVAGLAARRRSRFPSCAAAGLVDLLVALDVALQHAVFDPLAVQAERFALLRVERAWPGSVPARARPGTRP